MRPARAKLDTAALNAYIDEQIAERQGSEGRPADRAHICADRARRDTDRARRDTERAPISASESEPDPGVD